MANDSFTCQVIGRSEEFLGPTCTHCRSSKVKCDRQTPCTRCANKGIECIPCQYSNKRRRVQVDHNAPPGYHDFQCIPVSPLDTSAPKVRNQPHIFDPASQQSS